MRVQTCFSLFQSHAQGELCSHGKPLQKQVIRVFGRRFGATWFWLVCCHFGGARSCSFPFSFSFSFSFSVSFFVSFSPSLSLSLFLFRSLSLTVPFFFGAYCHRRRHHLRFAVVFGGLEPFIVRLLKRIVSQSFLGFWEASRPCGKLPTVNIYQGGVVVVVVVVGKRGNQWKRNRIPCPTSIVPNVDQTPRLAWMFLI